MSDLYDEVSAGKYAMSERYDLLSNQKHAVPDCRHAVSDRLDLLSDQQHKVSDCKYAMSDPEHAVSNLFDEMPGWCDLLSD
jgi:hypothetical protein